MKTFILNLRLEETVFLNVVVHPRFPSVIGDIRMWHSHRFYRIDSVISVLNMLTGRIKIPTTNTPLGSEFKMNKELQDLKGPYGDGT